VCDAPATSEPGERPRVQRQLARKLAEVLLGMSVAEWVAPRKAAGQSWDKIARELTVALGTEISRETARRWAEARD
jgi:hypothetical protein